MLQTGPAKYVGSMSGKSDTTASPISDQMEDIPDSARIKSQRKDEPLPRRMKSMLPQGVILATACVYQIGSTILRGTALI